MKILTPTEAIRYGMSTLFSSLLAEILRDYNDAGAFVNSKEINIAVHVAPSFSDTNPFPITGVDFNVHLFLNDLPVKCVCFTLLEPTSLSSPLPPLPVDWINDRLMANRCVLHLPDKNDTSRAINEKHLTYNKLIEFFGSKTIGWANGENLRKRTKRRGVYVIGIGHQFVDHLSSILSLLSDHSEKFEIYRIKMATWLTDCTIKKTSNTKLSLVSSQIQDAVFSTRGAMIGDWVQIPKWNCYLADPRELTMSLYILFMKREKGAEIQSGRAKDPRHHQLSTILNLREYFDPMMLDEYVMFRGHGTPSTLTSDGRAKEWRSFLKNAPNLQVDARCFSFVPGGPYPKMLFFWKVPQDMSTEEIVRNNSIVEVQIADNLPVFESRKAAPEIRNLLGNVSGVSSRAANLIRKLLNPNLRQYLTLREEENMTRLANMVMNTDCEEDMILDMPSSNGYSRQHDDYFSLANKYIEYEGKM
jgi:hypothetical protein